MKEYPQEVVAGFRDALRALGFKKRSGEIFTLTLSERALGWIGLNRAVARDQSVEINPVVGVRHQDVESLLADLRHHPVHAYIPATIAMNIGYWTPARTYMPWVFSPGDGLPGSLPDAIECIQVFGLPFMRAHADLRVLVQTMQTRTCGIPDQIAYRLPVGLFLLGELDQARQVLGKLRAAKAAVPIPAHLEFLAFADELEKLICNAD